MGTLAMAKGNNPIQSNKQKVLAAQQTEGGHYSFYFGKVTDLYTFDYKCVLCFFGGGEGGSVIG